jgi:hypothetical protein
MFGNHTAVFDGYRNGKEAAMRSVMKKSAGSPVKLSRHPALLTVMLMLWPSFASDAQTPSDSLPVKSQATAVKQNTIDTSGDTLSKTLSDTGMKSPTLLSDSSLKAGGRSNDIPGQPTLPEDTTYRFWNHAYWGIGAGWALGSFPLYSEWENGLPDSSAEFAGSGSIVPKFTVREAVNSYNIFWPLKASFTPFVNERQALSLEGSFFFLFTGKSFLASLLPGGDSLHSSVEVNQSCAAYFFTIGVDYRKTIPEEYFKVEGANRTSAIIGLSITPLLHFSKQTSFSYSNIPDSTIARIEKNIDNRSFNGMGCSWKLGISSLRKLSKKSGVEIGITYIGHYMGLFKNGSSPMVWRDLNPGHARPDEKISCISNTFELSIILQSGKAQKDQSAQ